MLISITEWMFFRINHVFCVCVHRTSSFSTIYHHLRVKIIITRTFIPKISPFCKYSSIIMLWSKREMFFPTKAFSLSASIIKKSAWYGPNTLAGFPIIYIYGESHSILRFLRLFSLALRDSVLILMYLSIKIS